MAISFGGIQNLSVRSAKLKDSRVGCYFAENGQIKTGVKTYSKVKIECDLTDDEDGNDLTNFYQALSNSNSIYMDKCIDPENPNHIVLDMTRSDVVDTNVYNSQFRLNGEKIILHNRKDLAMYTYMAHLTRKISNLPTVSYDTSKSVNTVNRSIAQKAIEFIESV
jgi:hypothetical protein